MLPRITTSRLPDQDMADLRRSFRSLSDSHIGFFDNRDVLRGEEFVTAGACETASWHPYCHATFTQFVAVPSSATLPSFPDDGAVARDWPVLGVG